MYVVLRGNFDNGIISIETKKGMLFSTEMFKNQNFYGPYTKINRTYSIQKTFKIRLYEVFIMLFTSSLDYSGYCQNLLPIFRFYYSGYLHF